MHVYKESINLNWGRNGKMVENFRNELFEEVTFMQRRGRGAGVIAFQWGGEWETMAWGGGEFLAERTARVKAPWREEKL